MVVSLQSHSQLGAPPPPDFGRSQYWKQGNEHCKWSLTGGRTGRGTKPSFQAGFKLVDRGRLCMSRAWENEANKKILACSFVQNDASTIMRSITGLLQSLLVSQATPFAKGVACETKCYMLQCQNAKDDEDLSKLSLTARSRMV